MEYLAPETHLMEMEDSGVVTLLFLQLSHAELNFLYCVIYSCAMKVGVRGGLVILVQ